MKNRMKKVLIALDYDPTAQKVAETGFSMAKAMNAEVILLHVMVEPVYYSTPEFSPLIQFSGFIERGKKLSVGLEELQKAIQDFLDKSKHHLGDKTIQTLVEEGDIAESIIKTAKETHADIIVVGSHSKKWLENILMGSVTERPKTATNATGHNDTIVILHCFKSLEFVKPFVLKIVLRYIVFLEKPNTKVQKKRISFHNKYHSVS